MSIYIFFFVIRDVNVRRCTTFARMIKNCKLYRTRLLLKRNTSGQFDERTRTKRGVLNFRILPK